MMRAPFLPQLGFFGSPLKLALVSKPFPLQCFCSDPMRVSPFFRSRALPIDETVASFPHMVGLLNFTVRHRGWVTFSSCWYSILSDLVVSKLSFARCDLLSANCCISTQTIWHVPSLSWWFFWRPRIESQLFSLLSRRKGPSPSKQESPSLSSFVPNFCFPILAEVTV